MSRPHGIVLGYPFDQLLQQECPLLWWKHSSGKMAWPGLRVPGDGQAGTGNIVICGPPGSGKSTLALQFAVQSARRPENSAVSAYISLESTPAEIRQKAKPFGWDEHLLEACHLHDLTENASPDLLARALLDLLTQPKNCAMRQLELQRVAPSPKVRSGPGHKHSKHVRPKVLISSVTPRPVGESATDEPLFWKRYKQIKALLSAGQKLRRWKFDREEALSQVNYLLPLVVLDGLNMLTGAPLTREEMHQLFRLFRRHETIGLLVTESSQSSPFDSTMADVVISLASKEDCGYLLQHLEIEKSRYMGQVRGRHPFKILPLGTEIGTEKASLYTPMVPKKDKRALRDGKDRL